MFRQFLLIKNHLMFHKNISAGKMHTRELRIILQKLFQPVVWIYVLLLSGRWMIYIIMFNPSCMFICNVNRVEEFQVLVFISYENNEIGKIREKSTWKIYIASFIVVKHCQIKFKCEGRNILIKKMRSKINKMQICIFFSISIDMALTETYKILP